MHERATPEGARLFVALDPPEEIRALIGSWQRQIATPGLRPVAGQALHLTLAFLGSRPVGEVDALAGLVESLPAEPVAARVEPAPLPLPRRRPRVWAFAVASRGAVALHVELAERLARLELPGYEPDRRPFRPHLTALRVPGAARRGGAPGRAELDDHPLPGRDGHAFGFVRVALYRSDPRPEGSTYTRLAAIELPHTGDPQKR